jgi:hypothetical protein
MPSVKIPGTNFTRDTGSMVLLNNDEAARNDYHSKVQMMKVQKQEINNVKSEMDSVKKDMNEIKLLLKALLEKGSNG